MHCFKERIALQGDYNTESARTLALVFEKCDSSVRDDCKSDQEIREFMKTKYFVTIENYWSFKQDEYKESTRLSPEAKFNWFMMNSVLR